ncbi:flagellin [Aromatoleum buckelii]|uniref:Flagellin n=1 Tax=Aromatoleum buckelii TaxID=200254 RepID=A0ABX1N7F9_9RHOO|nr:flagellin [Aromatoleum buckelii]MCK0510938.1 flagellin domain-containing protein [Aromatoleum buckelii]
MAQMINTNIASLNSQNNLTKSQASLTTSLQRLSSGLRINSAKDDAAGLAISERMSSQISGLNQATRNSNDGISMSQTVEGALSSISDSLQRIRELAVQSANGSNTDADRASMQEETEQLLAEIDRVATQTKFNGRALLDGSLDNQQFQVGANAGETISFSVASARTSKLGSSDAAAITTAQNAGTTALKEGAFSLNGVMIGPSLASADTASTAEAERSSIAKAAAVNAKSAETGVTATVNATEVGGSAMTASAESGAVTINGVAISISTTGDAATSRASVVAAINASSQQTGVTAVDSGSANGGVKLIAADGRNIDIDFDATLDTATTGLAGEATYSGSITLNSDKAIAITSNMTGAAGTGGIKDAGLQVGTYSAQTAYASTTSAAPAVAASLTTFAAGDFTINGALIGSSVAASDTASSANKASSGIAKAAAINALSSQTGVTATVNATVVEGASMTAAAFSGTLTINGVTTDTIATTTDAAASRKAVVDAINAKSGQTGVIATDTNDDTKGVTLAAADGRNIIMSQTGTLTTGSTGLHADVLLATGSEKIATSTLTLSSTKAFTIEGGTNSAGTTALNLKVGTYGAGRSGDSLDNLDISTVEGANKALTSIDNALKSVNSARSSMGAVQNRFSAVVSNLQTTSENMTASRSRIRDADFATETANLTRGQILQQAGTAMLAQANGLPNGVLSLLRG